MEVLYGEGVATHTGPESCVAGRETRGEALTGVRVGQPLSGVKQIRGAEARFDRFLGLAKTCAKLGIAFWDYLGARLSVPDQPATTRAFAPLTPFFT